MQVGDIREGTLGGVVIECRKRVIIEKSTFQCLYPYHGINRSAKIDVECGGG